jgi:hypothetical protein
VQNGEDDLDTLADILVSQSTISHADCYGVKKTALQTLRFDY